MRPPKGYEHFVCPRCGRTFCLPWRPGEEPPWCLHHDTNYSWRAPYGSTGTGEAGNVPPWTQTVLADVRFRYPAGADDG